MLVRWDSKLFHATLQKNNCPEDKHVKSGRSSMAIYIQLGPKSAWWLVGTLPGISVKRRMDTSRSMAARVLGLATIMEAIYWTAHEHLYGWLDTTEGARKMYILANACHYATEDIAHLKHIKDDNHYFQRASTILQRWINYFLRICSKEFPHLLRQASDHDNIPAPWSLRCLDPHRPFQSHHRGWGSPGSLVI